MSGLRLGIDLGGTKIEIAALAADGQIVLRERTATPRGDYGATLQSIAQLVQSAEQKLGAGTKASIGIGIPGALEPATGLVKNANSTWLIGQPLQQDLQRLLNRPVRLANDANCFALSEASDGAAAGAASVFGVILGTGVGGGIVIHDQVLVGANAIAGEWGHTPMPGEALGLECFCGQRDCIEHYLSGPALAADYARFCNLNTPISAEEIVARAAAGERSAEETLQRYERRLARALAGVINLLDPDIIVLGGGLSNLLCLYENVPRLWGQWIISRQIVTQLKRNQHGDSSGVRGAAWLWPLV